MLTPAKRPKKPTWYKKKAIALAKALVRSRGLCEMCGSKDNQLHGSHIFPEPFHVVAANPRNIVCLCASCHKLSKFSWHQSPVHGVKWLERTHPGRIEELEDIINKDEPVDWKATCESLQERVKSLSTGEPT
jgi:hypothetical protein